MQWNLIKIRRENGDTQHDLAHLLHISDTSYGAKERGESQFKSDEMFIISNYYGKEISEIFLPSKYAFSRHKVP